MGTIVFPIPRPHHVEVPPSKGGVEVLRETSTACRRGPPLGSVRPELGPGPGVDREGNPPLRNDRAKKLSLLDKNLPSEGSWSQMAPHGTPKQPQRNLKHIKVEPKGAKMEPTDAKEIPI